MSVRERICIICTVLISPMHRKLTVGHIGKAVCNTHKKGRDKSERSMREREHKGKGSLTISIK